MERFDPLIETLASYTAAEIAPSDEALHTAYLCLLDSLGCCCAALAMPACVRVVSPLFPKSKADPDWLCHIPGTSWELDPIEGAFTLGSLIRWLDYNDTWLAAEWGHPSDNLGALLALGEALASQRRQNILQPFTVLELLHALIKAYEIQGVLALTNSFNSVGLDHVLLVKVATAAVATMLLGGDEQTIANSISQAFVDLGPLRSYRHSPNVGARKSWAAGDATSRGLWLAFLSAVKKEQGYPTVLTAKRWGVQDVLFDQKPLTLYRPLGWYVMENILFKVQYPAEFHAQTAVEAACLLHREIKDKIDLIEKIEIETHSSAIRIIDKKGPLKNPADRDHCLQYMVAVALLKGNLTEHDYEEEAASDKRIDFLRDKMVVRENEEYSRSYYDSEKRAIANGLQIYFKDGSTTKQYAIEYPLGHKFRRAESLPFLKEKFKRNLKLFPQEKVEKLSPLMDNYKETYSLAVDEFIKKWIITLGPVLI